MKSDPATRDNTKYCEFHRDYGHRTDNCIQLKKEIEYLIQRGYLRRFIPSLNAIKAIPFAYHLVIKFPTIHGVGMVRGDQRVARECYTASMKQRAVDNINMDELDMRDEVLTRPEPSEELEPVPLDDDPEHLAYIGSKLAEDLKSLLTQFLRQNKDVFA